MKLLLKILLVGTIFVGCATQSQVEQPYKQTIISKKTNNQKINNQDIINDIKIKSETHTKIKKQIIILYSTNKIGHYAIDAANTSMVYMLNSNIDFEIKTIDIDDYSWESLKAGFAKAEDIGADNIIALLTNESYDDLVDVENIDRFNIYLPLIHRNNVRRFKKNIIFGGVDYDAQLKKLLTYSNSKDIELFDNSSFGLAIHKKLDKIDQSLIYSKSIDDFSADYANTLRKSRSKLNRSTLFLNTPIVKSSILLSQLRANDIKPYRILSTQINYTPLILSLTQADDRRDLIVASSIDDIHDSLGEKVTLLKSDIRYDWLNYSTLIGVDYFINDSKNRLKSVVDNQVQYDIKLYKAKYHSFKQIN